MSIPDSPNTRKEMYLNAIAGGNGSIPSQPYTREEMYLDSIARNGGGGGGGGGTGWMVVNATYDGETNTTTLDKTAREILAAAPFVMVINAHGVSGSTTSNTLGSWYVPEYEGGDYIFAFGGSEFTCNSVDDYPSYYHGSGGVQ